MIPKYSEVRILIFQIYAHEKIYLRYLPLTQKIYTSIENSESYSSRKSPAIRINVRGDKSRRSNRSSAPTETNRYVIKLRIKPRTIALAAQIREDVRATFERLIML